MLHLMDIWSDWLSFSFLISCRNQQVTSPNGHAPFVKCQHILTWSMCFLFLVNHQVFHSWKILITMLTLYWNDFIILMLRPQMSIQLVPIFCFKATFLAISGPKTHIQLISLLIFSWFQIIFNLIFHWSKLFSNSCIVLRLLRFSNFNASYSFSKFFSLTISSA